MEKLLPAFKVAAGDELSDGLTLHGKLVPEVTDVKCA